MKPCFKLSSLLAVCLIAACTTPYRALTPLNGAAVSSALQYRPVFEKKLYRCVVDGRFLFKKFHLSGVLLFRKMSDNSTRVVFQNEIGFSFFDFAWDRNGSFTVKQIIPQLDKPAVIRTLEKDLGLLLMTGLDTATERYFTKGSAVYHRFDAGNGYAWYIVEQGGVSKIEYSGKRKITTITLTGRTDPAALPDSVLFRHHKAHFTIHLHQIQADVSE